MEVVGEVGSGGGSSSNIGDGGGGGKSDTFLEQHCFSCLPHTHHAALA